MMHTWQRTLLAVLVGLVTFAIVVSVGTGQALAVVPDSAARLTSAVIGDACSPNSTQSVVIADSPPQCIAEEMRSTRVRITSSCLTGVKALWPKATYSKSECRGGGIQAEAIAQARVIA